MTKEENELYGGSFPQAGKDHHQDLYEHNLKYNEAEYHNSRTFITRRRRNNDEDDKLKFIEELNNVKELTLIFTIC